MSPITVSLLLGSLTCSAALAAQPEPGPEHDGPRYAGRDTALTAFADFEYLQRGKLHFDFGAVDYRLARDGLNLNYRTGGAATRAIVGFDGDRRLELEWRLRSASVTLAIDEQDRQSRYRLQLTREF